MRIVTGKHVRPMDRAELIDWTANYTETTIDLGTGDGRFVRHVTSQNRHIGAIGVDLCAANLGRASRASGGNALFVVADALALPDELGRVASRVTINFPWGSLLRGLLAGHAGLLAGLAAVGRAGAVVEIRLNAGALAEAGWTLSAGSERVTAVLRDAGFDAGPTSVLDASDLCRWPTTWAKRLAFGRDPRAYRIDATLGHAPGALHL